MKINAKNLINNILKIVSHKQDGPQMMKLGISKMKIDPNIIFTNLVKIIMTTQIILHKNKKMKTNEEKMNTNPDIINQEIFKVDIKENLIMTKIKDINQNLIRI